MHGSVTRRSGTPGKRRPAKVDSDCTEHSEYPLDEEAQAEMQMLTVVTLDLRLDTETGETGEGEAVVVPVMRQNDPEPWYLGWLDLRLSVDDEAA